MLISSGGCVVIEAKVESGYGRSAATGYDQETVQQVLVRLLPAIVTPTFGERHIAASLWGSAPGGQPSTELASPTRYRVFCGGIS